MSDQKRKDAVERMTARIMKHGKINNQKMSEREARLIALRAEKINRRNKNG